MANTGTFFRSGPDTHLDAHIWLGPEAFYPYMKGYTLAFETLLRRATRCPREAKFLVLPILFNFRHAVELQLKNIIYLTEDYREGRHKYPKGHDIKALWDIAKSVVGEGFAPPEWKQARLSEAVIFELDRLDKAADKFRFPENSKEVRNFSYQGRSINLVVLKKTLPQVLDFLDTIAFGLRNQKSFSVA